MAKQRIEWWIFKKTSGVKYPGEHWEECINEKDARRRYEMGYENDPIYCVVKITYERA